MKQYILAVLLGTFFCSYTMAQEIKLKGVIKTENQEVLAGANVLVKETSRGTQSNLDGEFSIDVEKGQHLIFSYVGYDNYELKVVDANPVVILLKSSSDLSEVVILGSRTGARSRLESAVPVDAIDVQGISESTGRGSLSYMLNAAIPSFSAVTHARLGLTDHVDPASLRGMSPGQTLVLLNQKRLHPSSIVNVVGGTNMGSVGTDLNIIPAFALEKIEVLRDGASSQYGSDAIAGVIDLQMKRNTDGLSGQISYGGRLTSDANNFTGGWDGDEVQVDLNYGTKLGNKGGFINITGSYQHQGRTYRSMETNRPLFNLYNAVYNRAMQDNLNLSEMFGNINALNGQDLADLMQALRTYAGQVDYLDSDTLDRIAIADLSEMQEILRMDVTDQELDYQNLSRSDFSLNVGQPKINSTKLFFNAEYPISHSATLYGFGGYNFRNTSALDYTKYPNDTHLNVPSIYPLGYQPSITSKINDYTFTAGLKGVWGEWDYDLSNTIGENILDLEVRNTANLSLLYNTPTTMDLGGMRFLQNTANFDVRRGFDIWSGLNIAMGTEYRLENYQIKSGQEETYQSYDIFGNPVDNNTADLDRRTDFFGNLLPGGNQGRGGSNPENEVNKSRHSFAVYGEAEANFTESFLLGAALRYENYSDFGSTANFKVSSRIKLAPHLNFRTAVATGFRAPSMAQIYYSANSTLLLNGVGRRVGLFRNDSEVAKAFGIPQLKEERSRSFTAGFTFEIPEANLSFTADAFVINVRDQIILTESFAKPSGSDLTPDQQALLAIFERNNINEAQFFANAIDVETKGFDFVMSHKYSFDNIVATNSFGLNLNRVKRVGDIHSSQIIKDAGLEDAYFSVRAKNYLEASAPRIKMNLINDWTFGKLNVFLQNSFYGKVWGADNENLSQLPYIHTPHSARVLTDLSFSYPLSPQMQLTIGSNNIFDVHQTKNVEALAFYRQFPYDVRVSQFDLDGRYVYARMHFKL